MQIFAKGEGLDRTTVDVHTCMCFTCIIIDYSGHPWAIRSIQYKGMSLLQGLIYTNLVFIWDLQQCPLYYTECPYFRVSTLREFTVHVHVRIHMYMYCRVPLLVPPPFCLHLLVANYDERLLADLNL